jgi:hypothetical protein
VYLELVDFDKVFRSHQGKAPVIINDVPAFSETDKDKLNRIIFTTFSGDLLATSRRVTVARPAASTTCT